ncbi:hypothetical protein CDAR_91711 [Caerostris darwini]|uniref:Uncharacterized protein n=1 Tax=Caerostris darwini TaxID=1538125 RepID=A0AAV4QSE5_9ARAC|nr:hypothetical protein CDAR_91711 [Caerostris darwini]
MFLSLATPGREAGVLALPKGRRSHQSRQQKELTGVVFATDAHPDSQPRSSRSLIRGRHLDIEDPLRHYSRLLLSHLRCSTQFIITSHTAPTLLSFFLCALHLNKTNPVRLLRTYLAFGIVPRMGVCSLHLLGQKRRVELWHKRAQCLSSRARW